MEKIIYLFVPTLLAMLLTGQDWTLILVDRNNPDLVIVVGLFYIKGRMSGSIPTLAMARVQIRKGDNGRIHRSEAGRLSIRLNFMSMLLSTPHQ
jgi:hypothetical protein